MLFQFLVVALIGGMAGGALAIIAVKYGSWTVVRNHEDGWNKSQMKGHPRNP